MALRAIAECENSLHILNEPFHLLSTDVSLRLLHPVL